MGVCTKFLLNYSKFTIMDPYQWGDQLFPSKISLVGTQLALIAFCTTSCSRGGYGDPVALNGFNARMEFLLNCIWQPRSKVIVFLFVRYMFFYKRLLFANHNIRKWIFKKKRIIKPEVCFWIRKKICMTKMHLYYVYVTYLNIK